MSHEERRGDSASCTWVVAFVVLAAIWGLSLLFGALVVLAGVAVSQQLLTRRIPAEARSG